MPDQPSGSNAWHPERWTMVAHDVSPVHFSLETLILEKTTENYVYENYGGDDL